MYKIKPSSKNYRAKTKARAHYTLRSKLESPYVVIFVVLFAIVGSILLIISHASSPGVSIEPENGTISAPATTCTDSAASGGSCIQFRKQGAVQIIPSNIVSDCSVDVTTEINNWIGTVPNNSQLQFKANACYKIEGTLTLNNRNDLVIDGNGATFRAFTNAEPADTTNWTQAQWRATRTRSQWSTSGGTNLTLKNMIIWGPNVNGGTATEAAVCGSYPSPCLEAQMAFNVIATRGVTIQNNQAHNIYGDFVYFGNNGSSFAGNATVSGNKFWANGRQGISVVGGDHITISNNDISQIRMSTFDIEPNTAAGGGFNITIDHNTIGSGRLTLLSDQGQGSNIHDITVSNNVLTGHPINIIVRPPAGVRRTNFHFVNNTSDTDFGTSVGGSFNFTRIDGIEIRGNTQPMQAGRNMTGVYLTDSTGAVVTGNTFTNGIATVNADATSKVTTDCGNRLTATGLFDFPNVCTP